MQSLLESGSDINTRDRHGKTVLHYASHRTADCMKILLDAGADPQATDYAGNSILHDAVVLLEDQGENSVKEAFDVIFGLSRPLTEVSNHS